MREPMTNGFGEVRFPRLEARDLEGRALALPDAFAGELNLVIVAFRRDQQAMVDTWTAWFSKIALQHPTLGLYEVPVIATRWSPARPLIDGGMAQAVSAQAVRRALRTVDLRDPDEQRARRVPHRPVPVVQGHWASRVVR